MTTRMYQQSIGSCVAVRALPRSFWQHTLGAAVVEFGLILPVLMTLLYGTIEITRFILISQKVEKLAHTVADVTAQSSVLTTAALAQLMSAAGDIMSPFPLVIGGASSNTEITISSLYRAPGVVDATINWRYPASTSSSKLGTVGSKPSMPVTFTFEERENIISTEVYYTFSPLLTSQFFGKTTIYRSAFYKPRLGALTSPPT